MKLITDGYGIKNKEKMLYQDENELLIKFKNISEEHMSKGYLEYEHIADEYDKQQTHFYLSEIEQGNKNYPGLPNEFDWMLDIHWQLIFTDRYITAKESDIGSFEVKGQWVKDRYFDYAKACVPYLQTTNIHEIVPNITAKLNESVFSRKPSRLAYLVAAIINKNDPDFCYWYKLLLNNIELFKQLEKDYND